MTWLTRQKIGVTCWLESMSFWTKWLFCHLESGTPPSALNPQRVFLLRFASCWIEKQVCNIWSFSKKLHFKLHCLFTHLSSELASKLHWPTKTNLDRLQTFTINMQHGLCLNWAGYVTKLPKFIKFQRMLQNSVHPSTRPTCYAFCLKAIGFLTQVVTWEANLFPSSISHSSKQKTSPR